MRSAIGCILLVLSICSVHTFGCGNRSPTDDTSDADSVGDADVEADGDNRRDAELDGDVEADTDAEVSEDADVALDADDDLDADLDSDIAPIEPWLIVRGGPNLDEAWGIDLGEHDDLYVAMHLGSPAITQAFVSRLNAEDGTTVWETEWGEVWSEEVFVVDEVEGVVHVGGCNFTSLNLWDTQALLLRFDAESGSLIDPIWTHDDPGAWNEIDGIDVTDESIYLSGWGASDSGDMLLAELGRDGVEIEHAYWGSSDWEEANGHMVAVGDRLYVAGRYGAIDVGRGGDSVVVAFERSDLSEAWSRTWGEPGTREDALGLTTDGERLYVVGMREGAAGVFLLAYDLNGELIWDVTWDDGGGEVGRSIRVDETDGSLIVGLNSNASGSNDIVMLRVDSESGSVLDRGEWGGPEDEEVHDFVLRGDSGWLAGQTKSVGSGNYDAMFMRFSHRPWAFPPVE